MIAGPRIPGERRGEIAPSDIARLQNEITETVQASAARVAALLKRHRTSDERWHFFTDRSGS